MKTYHYIISGRVQGVAFRHYTIHEAEKYAISGLVKNLPNGDVEVLAQGDDNGIAEFEAFLHRGPRLARVEKVVKELIENQMVFHGFDISW